MPERENSFVEGQRVFVRTACGLAAFAFSVAFAMVYLKYSIVSFYFENSRREFFCLLILGVSIGYLLIAACFGRFMWFLKESKSCVED